MTTATWAIVVVYHPTERELESVLSAISPQVERVLIVDNGGFERAEIAAPKNSRLLKMVANVGIAAAQNQGVAFARNQGAERIVFLDQDSIPTESLVNQLTKAFIELEDSGEKPAAVGPRIVDSMTDTTSSFFRSKPVAEPKPQESAEQYVEAGFLISSGTLTSVRRWQEVGPYEERLFIDGVDFEWCFRARHKGFKCFGVTEAAMKHPVGDDGFHIRVANQTARIPVHGPVRRYYIMRNRLHLYKRAYVPLPWKLRDLRRLAVECCYFALVAKPRAQYIASMAKGIRDGVMNVYGPIPT